MIQANIRNSHENIPVSDNKRGSDCSGTDGTANRTLTLSESAIYTESVNVTLNKASLHEGAGLDFTISDNVITFLVIVDDTDYIRVTFMKK